MSNSHVFGARVLLKGTTRVDIVLLGLEPNSCSAARLCQLSCTFCTDGETEAQEGEEPRPRLHRKHFEVSVPAQASASPSGEGWRSAAAGSNLLSQSLRFTAEPWGQVLSSAPGCQV